MKLFKFSYTTKIVKVLIAIVVVCMLMPYVGMGTVVAQVDEATQSLPLHTSLVITRDDASHTDIDVEDDWDNPQKRNYDTNKPRSTNQSGSNTIINPAPEDQKTGWAGPKNTIAPAYLPVRPHGLALDVTDHFNVTAFQLWHSSWWSDLEPVPPLAHGHLSPWNDIFAFNFTIESSLQGGTLQNGDTVRLRIPHIPEGQLGFLNAQNSAWQDFYDAYEDEDYYYDSWYNSDYPPAVIGRWRIYAGHVEIEFTENAEGLAYVRAGFMTGAVLYSSVQTGGVRHISFGGRTHAVNFEARNWRWFPFSPWLTTEGISPTRVEWRIDLNRVGLWELVGVTFPDDVEYIFGDYPDPLIMRDNYLVEIQLEGTFISAAFHTRIARPLEVINSQDYFFNMPSSRTQPVDFSSHMSRIYRIDDEEYEYFKERVMASPFQWGVWYEYDGGYQTLLAYFGTLGVDGPRIIDVNPDFINWVTNSAMITEGWPEHFRSSVYAWFETLYGPDNAIGGRIVHPSIRIVEEHLPESYGRDIHLEVNNSYNFDGVCDCARWGGQCWCYYWSGCYCGGPQEGGFSRWSWAYLPASDAWATGVPGSHVRLYLYNQDAVERIAGVTFQLQSLLNGNWVNLRRFATNTGGYFNAYVGIGDFRFVQVDVADDGIYTLANSAHNSYTPALGVPYSGQFSLAGHSISGIVRRVYNTQNPFLTIYIEDENNNIVPGAIVVIRAPGGAVIDTITTGSSGSVRVQLPPNTVYEISATHPSFAVPPARDVSVGGTDEAATIVMAVTPNNGGGSGGSGGGSGGSDNGVLANAPPSMIPMNPNHNAYLIGFADGTVRPGQTITRAEVATIFFRLIHDNFRIEAWSQTNPFTDVNINQWHNNAISTMTNAEILNGRSDGRFAPNEAITRAEFVAIASRFVADVQVDVSQDAFDDIAGHWAEKYIHAVAALGWVEGDGTGAFRPNDRMTRAEIAAALNRMLDRILAEDGTSNVADRQINWPDNANPNAWYYLHIQEASHTTAYERNAAGYIVWVDILEHLDWSVLERPESRPQDILRR